VGGGPRDRGPAQLFALDVGRTGWVRVPWCPASPVDAVACGRLSFPRVDSARNPISLVLDQWTVALNEIGGFGIDHWGRVGNRMQILQELLRHAVAPLWGHLENALVGRDLPPLAINLVFLGFGPGVAMMAALTALITLPLLRAYHPPGVALAMYPPLLHSGLWFAIQVVLPFTLVTVISAALMSRLLYSRPRYPVPLRAEIG